MDLLNNDQGVQHFTGLGSSTTRHIPFFIYYIAHTDKTNITRYPKRSDCAAFKQPCQSGTIRALYGRCISVAMYRLIKSLQCIIAQIVRCSQPFRHSYIGSARELHRSRNQGCSNTHSTSPLLVLSIIRVFPSYQRGSICEWTADGSIMYIIQWRYDNTMQVSTMDDATYVAAL